MIRFSIFVLALMMTVQPTRAQQHDPHWMLRVDLSFVNPSGDFVSTGIGDGTIGTEINTAFGAGLRGEYQFSPRLGFELGVLGAGSPGVKTGIFDGTIGNEVRLNSFTQFAVGLNVHLTPDQPVDLYLGPQLALLRYGDEAVRATIGGVGTSVSVDNDVGWGAIIGLDVPLGKRGWMIQTNLRYIETQMSGSEDFFKSNFDPLVFSVGFGFRF